MVSLQIKILFDTLKWNVTKISYFPIYLVILTWGSAYKTRNQTKQNHSIRLIVFAQAFRYQTNSAFPLLNLLDALTVNNVYQLQDLKCTHLWHKSLLPFQNFFQYPRNVHSCTRRYASRKNLFKFKVRTNFAKQTNAYMATVLWGNIPANLKKLNVFNFSKQLKLYCLNNNL